MKKIAKYSVAALMLSFAAACNTIAGVGEDIESIGGAIEETADKDKKPESDD